MSLYTTRSLDRGTNPFFKKEPGVALMRGPRRKKKGANGRRTKGKGNKWMLVLHKCEDRSRAEDTCQRRHGAKTAGVEHKVHMVAGTPCEKAKSRGNCIQLPSANKFRCLKRQTLFYD